MQYTENFFTCKIENFIGFLKIGIPCIPQFCYIKMGFKGVYITQTCFPHEGQGKCKTNVPDMGHGCPTKHMTEF